MDFLEGFLLGPIWSDTEYETRRHSGFYWLVGCASFIIYLYMQIKGPILSRWLALPLWMPVFFFLFLLLATPFASRYYYNVNVVFKFFILAVQMFKYLFAFLSLYQRVLPLYQIKTETLSQDVIDYINRTVTQSTETFTAMGQAVGMMVGILVGGLRVVLTLCIILLAGTLIPALFLFILQILQRAVDFVVSRYVLRSLDF